MKKRMRKNFCQSSVSYKTAKVAGEFIGILRRLFTSFLFNVFVFIAGFGCCFIVMEMNHQKQKSKETKTIVAEVEQKLVEMEIASEEASKKNVEVKEALEKLKDNIVEGGITNKTSR